MKEGMKMSKTLKSDIQQQNEQIQNLKILIDKLESQERSQDHLDMFQ